MTRRGKDAMFTVLFHVQAKRGKRQQLLDFLQRDKRESLERELGTLCFDIFQDPDIEPAFFVYEAYEDVTAFEEHKTHDPYLEWISETFQNEIVLRHHDLEPADVGGSLKL